MSTRDIDALISELYPGDAAAQRSFPRTSGAVAAPEAKAHSFDDDDDSTAQPAFTAPARSVPSGGGTAVPTAAVPWPTLPPGLAPGPLCPAGTVTLTSFASDAAIREQRRLLHLNPSQLGNAQVSRPQRPGLDDDGGRWCPYLRCRHCDHVVVRFQGAYWSRGLVPLSSKRGASPDDQTPAASPYQAIAAGSPPKPAETETANKAHSFDEDTDEEVSPPRDNSSNAAASAPPTATLPTDGNSSPSSVGAPMAPRDDAAMYMLMRYHYPDFGAFPADVLVRASDVHRQTAYAAYCCQCTWVSALEPTVRVLAPALGGPTPLPDQPTVASVTQAEPTSRPVGIQWVCKGHTC
jgi:hypothetical protein